MTMLKKNKKKIAGKRKRLFTKSTTVPGKKSITTRKVMDKKITENAINFPFFPLYVAVGNILAEPIKRLLPPLLFGLNFCLL